MTRFQLLISKTAFSQLNSLDESTKNRLKTHLKELENDPYQPRPNADIKKLSGYINPEFYRLRVGDYRAVYTIDGTAVKITEIIPRSKGYGWLE